MKAISLWQPWASAVALGVKRVETRHWSTKYTGPLAIHAAKRWTRAEKEFASVEHTLGRLPKRIPLGALVATCTLMGCRHTEDVVHQLGSIERLYGDYSPGRFAWFLTDIKPLNEPIGYRGAQGFFNVPDCEACEGSGETGHTHHDGTQYSDRNPPCVACGGTGVSTSKLEADRG